MSLLRSTWCPRTNYSFTITKNKIWWIRFISSARIYRGFNEWRYWQLAATPHMFRVPLGFVKMRRFCKDIIGEPSSVPGSVKWYHHGDLHQQSLPSTVTIVPQPNEPKRSKYDSWPSQRSSWNNMENQREQNLAAWWPCRSSPNHHWRTQIVISERPHIRIAFAANNPDACPRPTAQTNHDEESLIHWDKGRRNKRNIYRDQSNTSVERTPENLTPDDVKQCPSMRPTEPDHLFLIGCRKRSWAHESFQRN